MHYSLWYTIEKLSKFPHHFADETPDNPFKFLCELRNGLKAKRFDLCSHNQAVCLHIYFLCYVENKMTFLLNISLFSTRERGTTSRDPNRWSGQKIIKFFTYSWNTAMRWRKKSMAV